MITEHSHYNPQVKFKKSLNIEEMVTRYISQEVILLIISLNYPRNQL